MRISLASSFLCASLALSGTSAAYASEGAIAGGPIGGTDLRNAYLPAKPGFYGGLVGLYGFADQLLDQRGEKIANAHVPLKTAAIGVTYVYPTKLFGGTIASTVQVGYLTGTLQIGNLHHTENGVGDIYSDLFAWSRHSGSALASNGRPKLPYGLTLKLAYSMIFPTGHYSPTALYSFGHNVFYYIPNAAVSYLTGPNALGDGIEFSAHAFLDLASYNHATNYRSGTVGDLDFAVTERHGPVQAGLTGYYATQLDDDRKNGLQVQPDGKRLKQFYLGPIASFDLPRQLGTLKFKATFPIVVENGLNAKRFILIYGFRI